MVALNLPSIQMSDVRHGTTLILDIDETLLHSRFSFLNKFEGTWLRPGVRSFIQHIKRLGFELAIFTAAEETYANGVLALLPDKLIDMKLFRQHTRQIQNGSGCSRVKDLNLVGRPLHKCLIVDNLQESFCFQPDNGIQIHEFRGDEKDTQLLYLLFWLDLYVQSGLSVPDFIKKYRHYIRSTVGRRPHVQWLPPFTLSKASLEFGREVLGDTKADRLIKHQDSLRSALMMPIASPPPTTTVGDSNEVTESCCQCSKQDCGLMKLNVLVELSSVFGFH
ncbi:MAG: uncharacterized protein KVP18_004362 [Porospora cf. gigantea A]|uniref:uncharacterized protein n=2 Tax=Porospora cf. gigantea A TaxID=2853593 RepID=UPI0035594F02|nr:MAG: hypothetical protein KVP18_004362 [Porospora cf. gigantea A]